MASLSKWANRTPAALKHLKGIILSLQSSSILTLPTAELPNNLSSSPEIGVKVASKKYEYLQN